MVALSWAQDAGTAISIRARIASQIPAEFENAAESERDPVPLRRPAANGIIVLRCFVIIPPPSKRLLSSFKKRALFLLLYDQYGARNVGLLTCYSGELQRIANHAIALESFACDQVSLVALAWLDRGLPRSLSKRVLIGRNSYA